MYQELARSIFRIENFFDEISVIDKNGIIRYCEIFSPDTYSFTADEIIGKHFFEVFPSSNEENSEIYSVLKTGKPIASFEENCITYKGDLVKGYSSVYPLFENGELIGAAVALKFFGTDYAKEFIQVRNRESFRSEGSRHYGLDDIVTQDRGMAKIKEKILKVADLDSAVLIEGQTGTGKELVAQSIHYEGIRAGKPFISQNCSAIPANLLEGILFGTEKGSYTGAVTSKGLFELADGGTLFLDEINSMDLYLQSKLLRAIEEKSVRHLGGHKNLHVDVRIVAAINENPFTAISEGRLRSDLFYRLNVISLRLPTLKERQGDVAYLTDYFISRFNTRQGKKIQGLDNKAMTLFEHHSWPGNVRELKNVLEGIFAFHQSGLIGVADLPEYLTECIEPEKEAWEDRLCIDEKSDIGESWQEQVEAFEKQLLLKTIAAAGTKTAAAKKLGLTKQALNYKLVSLKLK